MRRDDLQCNFKKSGGREASKFDSTFLAKYSCCQLSSKKLKDPIVVSRMGKLYNKEAVIEYLITKPKNTKLEDVKTTKDFWEVEAHSNPLFGAGDSKVKASTTARTNDNSVFPFSCKFSSLVMNGHYKFVFGMGSKQLVSEQALRECNLSIFPAKFQQASTGLTVDQLHPMYEPKNEDQLQCPITSLKFGRPILLYPQAKADLSRAEEFQPSPKKRKKEKKDKGEKEDGKELKKDKDKIPEKRRRESSSSTGHVTSSVGARLNRFKQPHGGGDSSSSSASSSVPSTPFTPSRGGDGPKMVYTPARNGEGPTLKRW